MPRLRNTSAPSFGAEGRLRTKIWVRSRRRLRTRTANRSYARKIAAFVTERFARFQTNRDVRARTANTRDVADSSTQRDLHATMTKARTSNETHKARRSNGVRHRAIPTAARAMTPPMLTATATRTGVVRSRATETSKFAIRPPPSLPMRRSSRSGGTLRGPPRAWRRAFDESLARSHSGSWFTFSFDSSVTSSALRDARPLPFPRRWAREGPESHPHRREGDRPDFRFRDDDCGERHGGNAFPGCGRVGCDLQCYGSRGRGGRPFGASPKSAPDDRAPPRDEGSERLDGRAPDVSRGGLPPLFMGAGDHGAFGEGDGPDVPDGGRGSSGRRPPHGQGRMTPLRTHDLYGRCRSEL